MQIALHGCFEPPGVDDRQVIKRAIFVLTSPEAGEQFLRVLPELRGIGLTEATVLHLLPADPGPAEPMPELANWVRHFEAAIPKVELALKRGDAVKWLFELARVRDVDIVVISSATHEEDWDLERVSSPLRSLGIPILFLPESPVEGSLGSRVLVAVKGAATFERTVPQLVEWFGSGQLRAIRIVGEAQTNSYPECDGVKLETVQSDDDIATTLLQQAHDCRATLVTILADDPSEKAADSTGVPVVKPLVEESDRPVLIWPGSTVAG
jgi:hypothetical protein